MCFVKVYNTLKRLDTADIFLHFSFLAMLYKGDNFSDFLFVFVHTKSFSEKGPTLTGKKNAPKGKRANSFLLG